MACVSINISPHTPVTANGNKIGYAIAFTVAHVCQWQANRRCYEDADGLLYVTKNGYFYNTAES